MQIFSGICASEGFATGPVFRLRHSRPGLGRRVGEPRYELALYEAALNIACDELDALASRAMEADCAIFLVQKAMLADEGLIAEIRDYIQAGAGAAAAVDRAGGIYARRMREVGDGYLSERAADILDACQRVVDILDGGERNLQLLKQPSILVSEEVYPSDLITLDRELLLGIVTSRGAVTAHAAIVARSMGIPCVVMAGDSFLDACAGQPAALDGAAATVYLSPDEVTKARFAQRRSMAHRYQQSLDLLRGKACHTRDGVRLTLYANCMDVEDVALAVSMGAEGVGLLRSEMPLLGAMNAPSEEQQYEFYKQCLLTADGLPVYVSTFDFGAEKTLTGAVDETEKNPALGLRGVRYSLTHKTFFLQQLMAMLRAATHGPLHILLPMVTAPADVAAVRAELEHAKNALRLRGDAFASQVPLGIIIETPAAALQADTLAGMVDFFHIGTNDLAQYTMAADRSNAALQDYLRLPSRPVMRLTAMAAQAAVDAHIPVCACGEDAADPACALALARLGVRAFSVGARQLPELKAALLESVLSEA